MSSSFLDIWKQGFPRCLLVAEIGNNHQGCLDSARRCIDAAAAAGADAVKFQKRHLPSLFTRQALQKKYDGPHSFGPTYGSHREKLELSVEDMAKLQSHAERCGVQFYASVWDGRSLADMLSIGVSLLKLPSADISTESLLRQCAQTGLPLILSSGMSTLDEIDAAIAIVREYHDNCVLLHCNSTYPCPAENIDLPVMRFLAERYQLPTGYSGHEQGLGPSVAAATLGACMIERHFTLDKTQPGSDQACSLSPAEFAQLRRMVREVEAAMRATEKRLYPEEAAMAAKLRKSLVASRDLCAGHVLAADDLAYLCTDQSYTGMREAEAAVLSGKTLQLAIKAGELFKPDHLYVEKNKTSCVS